MKDSWKLDKEDALFVDVIHTNVGIFGKIEPTGHIDFYVNDGTYQPSCVDHKSNTVFYYFITLDNLFFTIVQCVVGNKIMRF